MKARLGTFLLFAACISSSALAQDPAPATTSKPSIFSRMKAASTSKASVAKPAANAPAKPMTASKGQAPRTAKSLDCSKQADAKNIHGTARKNFMSHCKRA
jgi:hypothetical protein